MKLAQLSLILTPLALLMASCGPTYTTNYTLLPAPTKEGQLCSTNVKLMADTCLNNCRQMAYNCRSGGFSAGLGYGSGGWGHHGMGGGIGYNQSLLDDRDCSSYRCEDSCKTAARQGHLNCGGTVTEEVVCTANCPKPQAQ